MSTRTIVIKVDGDNDFTVYEGDRSCDRLCWDEMLGTIAELTHPRIGQARYRMENGAERAAREALRAIKPPPVLDADGDEIPF